MKINITTDHDEYECETCGTDYATGGTVTVDGNQIVTLPAAAHCYAGQSFSEMDLLVIALRVLGHEVDIDDEPYHVTCNYED